MGSRCIKQQTIEEKAYMGVGLADKKHKIETRRPSQKARQCTGYKSGGGGEGLRQSVSYTNTSIARAALPHTGQLTLPEPSSCLLLLLEQRGVGAGGGGASSHIHQSSHTCVWIQTHPLNSMIKTSRKLSICPRITANYLAHCVQLIIILSSSTVAQRVNEVMSIQFSALTNFSCEFYSWVRVSVLLTREVLYTSNECLCTGARWRTRGVVSTLLRKPALCLDHHHHRNER